MAASAKHPLQPERQREREVDPPPREVLPEHQPHPERVVPARRRQGPPGRRGRGERHREERQRRDRPGRETTRGDALRERHGCQQHDRLLGQAPQQADRNEGPPPLRQHEEQPRGHQAERRRIDQPGRPVVVERERPDEGQRPGQLPRRGPLEQPQGPPDEPGRTEERQHVHDVQRGQRLERELGRQPRRQRAVGEGGPERNRRGLPAEVLDQRDVLRFVDRQQVGRPLDAGRGSAPDPPC